MTVIQDVTCGAKTAYETTQAAIRRVLRTIKAVYVVTKKHVPAWMGAILTICLFIPGPLDEFLILIVIAGMVGFKPVMRADLVDAVRVAWK